MIDFHTHIFPPNFPNYNKIFNCDKYIYIEEKDNQISLMYKNKLFRKIDKNCLYLEDRIKDMDAQGIQKQVLSIIPVLFCYEVPSNDLYQVAEFINNYISSCVDQYPDRFLALGTLPMQDTKLSLKMINSNLENKTKLNLIGYQIGSNINNVNLDNEKFFPIYELLEKNQLILFIHPWNIMGEKHIKDYWLPWLVGMPAENSRAICSMIFGGIFDKFPNETYKWLINLAYMTIGKHPDGVPEKYFINHPNWNIERKKFPSFKEVALDLGIAHDGLSGGVSVEDFNNDCFPQ